MSVIFVNQEIHWESRMRADRLLTLMMLLQRRGRTTAEELARELEVSTRTIYRDIDALSAAGVPVYAEGGPGGGYALLDSYRTTLTGLHEDEMRALFMLTIPSPIADLGVSQQLKAAILKLTTSLSDRHQEQADRIHQRLYLDAKGWFQPEEPVPYLQTIQEAVWSDRQLDLAYQRSMGSAHRRTVSPYGLVAKAGVWYLVCETEQGMRVYRISRVVRAAMTPTHFVRAEGFDLVDFWTEWSAAYVANLPQYPVTLRVAPEILPTLFSILGETVKEQLDNAEADTAGWRLLHHTFERMEEARAYVLGLGAAVEVIAPEELRSSVIDFATKIVTYYAR